MRLMPTNESVKSGGKLKKARWGRGRGRGRVYLGKNMSRVGRGELGVVTLSIFHGEIH